MDERTQDQINEVCEQACTILQATHDGDDLDPAHLWLLQEAVNGHLNEEGMTAFREVHAQVASGKYKKPWFHGIEHLTRDHEGYIYWKGVHVEHYSFGTDVAGEKKAAQELARRCRLLEEKGITPTGETAIWQWEKLAGQEGWQV